MYLYHFSTAANKPPIAAKPQIPKKPQNVINKPIPATRPAVNNKPALSPATTLKTTTKPPVSHGSSSNVTITNKPLHQWENHNGSEPVTTIQTSTIATLQAHENENDPTHIYDEVYQQAPTRKDLKGFFGATPTPATDPVFISRPNVDPSHSFPPPFAEKPKNKHRKHSRNRTEPQDDTTPYAVSQPLHSDKIYRKKKTSQTSADRSGDSGVAGLQMLPVPRSTRARFGGSTKSEDSDFGSTTSDQDSGSEGWDNDSWDETPDSQVNIICLMKQIYTTRFL